MPCEIQTRTCFREGVTMPIIIIIEGDDPATAMAEVLKCMS